MSPRRIAWGVFWTAILLAVPWVAPDEYFLHLIILAGFFVMLASGLNLLVGYMGQLSLGHGAFWGLGAYCSALLALKKGWSFWLALPAGGLLSVVFAFLLGRLILKVRGHRFVIITLAFLFIIQLVHYNWVSLTDGQNGLPGVPSPKLVIPGVGTIDFFFKTNFYYLLLVFCAITVFVCYRVANSRIGRALTAIRENEPLAESVGVSAFHYSMIAFVLGAFFAGLAGSLYAHYFSYVSPDIFDFIHIVEMLTMVLLGGRATILGPVVGALIFTGLPEALRFVPNPFWGQSWAPAHLVTSKALPAELQLMVFGLILVLGILYMPEGIVPWVRKRIGRRPAGLALEEARVG
ncbi:MAG: branched-chain amino acid ABC transporter permease [Nitrospinota bacterium]